MLNNNCIIALTLLATHTTTAFQVPLTPRTIKASTTFSRRKGVICAGTQQREIMTLSSGNILKNSKSLTLKAVEGDFDPEMISRDVSLSQSGSIKAKLKAMYKFTRPHTIRGTILASIAGTTRALMDTPTFSVANTNWSLLLPRAFIGMVALLLGNAFIVGINQVYDVNIDKLNKPFLPVASGEMSKRFAWISVLTAGTLGPLIV